MNKETRFLVKLMKGANLAPEEAELLLQEIGDEGRLDPRSATFQTVLVKAFKDELIEACKAMKEKRTQPEVTNVKIVNTDELKG